MKRTPVSIFVLLIAVLICGGCSEDKPDPEQQPVDVEDISTSAEITPYGGELQATDESGNVVTVNFPPCALMDTTTVTLIILGTHKELPIEERQVRAFEIRSADLVLYEPALISIDYQESTEGIEGAAIFRLRSDELLVPLSDHEYPSGNSTVKAATMVPGIFAEGKMTVEQINSQLDLLESSMGITLKSTGASPGNTNILSSGCEEYKAVWDDWAETAGGFLKFFEMRELTGYYDDLPPGERTFEEDCEKVCENIIEEGVRDVLDLGEHDDPCCREYAQTIESMMGALMQCGSQTATFDRMNERYNTVHDQCHTYLDITVEVNIESQGLLIMTSGEVMITLEGTGDGEATVTGNGELTVAGTGDAGGPCTSTISGQNFVSVTGTRDAAYIYTLTLNMNQVAMMVTVCPDFVTETPLVGGSSKEVTLGPGNGFYLFETEELDEGTANTQVTLHNPYIYVPQSE
ncbi:MAG: hypothetical protein R6U78_04590 [Bacteroidales bacterium]